MEDPRAATATALRCASCGLFYPEGESHSCAATPGEPTGPAHPVSPAGELPAGEVLGGRYQVLARLGQGGMGAVYKARHVILGSPVAVKVLLKPEDDESLQRFLQEARLASQIQHPNTVYISDYGSLERDGRPFLVMEHLEGP